MTEVGRRSMVGWLRDDEAFLAEVRRGQTGEALVALKFVSAGLAVQWVRPEVVEPERQRAGQLADEPDLLVTSRHRIEVKYRDLEFTCPDDYPFDTAFVGRRERWDRRKNLPLAIVLVSRPTTGAVVVPGKTRSRWVVETTYDRITRREEASYACRRADLQDVDELISYLRRLDAT